MNKKILWGQYERMRPDQLEAVFEKYPIAYLPWGASEYHGVHNPIGLDSIKAYGMSVDLAKAVGGLVLPVVHQASSTIKTYPGVNFKRHSLEFSEELIRMMCREYFEQLVDEGFKIVVLLTGHCGEPHFEILKSVADEFNQKHPDRYFWTLAEFEVLEASMLVANHSAIGETALQLYYAPELVALEKLPQDRETTLEDDAVSGADPRPATAAMGEIIVKTFVKNAGAKMEELMGKYVK